MTGKASEGVCIVLVGNKTDAEGQRQVEHAEAAAWAASKNLPYLETSAKLDHEITAAFVTMVAATVGRSSELPTLLKTAKVVTAQLGRDQMGAQLSGGAGKPLVAPKKSKCC